MKINILKKFFQTIHKNNNLCYNSHTKGRDYLYSVIDIANYVIDYGSQNQKEITNLRLQKILYYIQGYFLKMYDKPAFNEEIVAWPYGPVVPEAYYTYCMHGRNVLYLKQDVEYDFSMMSLDEKQLIRNIVDVCCADTISNIVNKTHQENPWKTTGKNNRISTEKIEIYFHEFDPLGLKLGE